MGGLVIARMAELDSFSESFYTTIVALGHQFKHGCDRNSIVGRLIEQR
jgi:hypothetical protein